MADLTELLEQLRATLGKMEAALDVINDAIAWTDRVGKVQWCNEPFAALAGRSRLELLGADLVGLLPLREKTASVSPQAHPLRAVLEGRLGAPRDYEMQRGGRTLALQVFAAGVKVGSQDAGAVLVLRDVTASKDAEAKFRALIEFSPDALVIVDQGGRIAIVNEQAEKVFGYPRGELLGRPLEILIPERHRTGHVAHRTGYFGQPRTRVMGAGLELYARRKNGSEFPVEISLGPLKTDEGMLVMSAIRDVTDRKKTAEALRRSEERARLTIENVRDYAIFFLDPQGRVATWNEGAQRLKGYLSEEIVGRHFSGFYPESDVAAGKPEAELKIAVQKGRFEDEGWRVRKDGSLFWANVVVTAVHAPGGELLGFSKITRDLTERKKSEDALRVAKAESEAYGKELEAFSYSVAHDLRAPLRSMNAFSARVLERCGGALDDDGKDALRRVRDASVRMGQLIDGLLGLSRVTRVAMRRERLDLAAAAQEIIAALRAADPTRTVEFIVPRELRVEGDRVLLRVVVENLLGNAWKYTSGHARARIEFGSRLEKNKRRVYFVRDDGAGFDQEFAGKLFKPFNRLHTRREFEGSGVGLATVQRIVARHRGRVWGVGQVERGATFYFTLWEENHEQDDLDRGG